MHATNLSSTGLMLWKTLKDDYGLDADALFLTAKLDPHQLHNPLHRYPDEKMHKLWQLALEQTGDECMGLNVAKHIHPTSLHALGFAWWSSSTLCDALQRLVRFYRILTDVQKLELEEHPEHYCLRLIRVSHFDEAIDQAYDAFFAADSERPERLGDLTEELKDPTSPKNKHLFYRQLPSFTIETDRPLHVNLDGEPIQNRRFEFRACPKALSVVLGTASA